MNETSIINYPGSKKKLLDFIYTNTYKYIDKNKYVLDIFSGTGCVGNMFACNGYKVISNDAEKYSYYISNALICSPKENINIEKIKKEYSINVKRLMKHFSEEIIEEERLLKEKSDKIENFDNKLIKIWNININNTYKIEDFEITGIEDLNININKIPFCLFSLYFSGYYFGLKQSIEIDSIRYAIEKCDKENSILYTALYYAMKESVFAKDGHMAQPLNHAKNAKKLFDVRNKSISEIFFNKLKDLEYKNISIDNKECNRTFNYKLDEILMDDFIKENVGFIYADPPYTDMQYSRYFHLLNTISDYYYPLLTIKDGKITSGLYTENRFQSPLSNKRFALSQIEMLIDFSSKNNINLAVSYAYPKDLKTQKSNRYTMDINDLILKMKQYYKKVEVIKEEYSHSNNRNSIRKDVYEYLVIGYTQKKYKIDNNIQKKVEKFKDEISTMIATNKNDLYNSMLYWSQKPYNVCNKIIEEFSEENEIIMDPFMGSGVTIIESMNKMYKRNAIGVDINDVPIFLCDTVLKKYDIELLENEIEKLLEEINQIEQEYNTKCIKCGDEGIIEKVLFDRIPTNKIKEITYSCKCSCKKIMKAPDETDIKNFNKTRKSVSIMNKKLIENSRIAVRKDENIKELFTNRNFYVLDQINYNIQKIKNQGIKQIINYAYLSIIHKSKIVDKKFSSQWPMWIPKENCVERNAVELFKKSLDQIKKALIYADKNYFLDSNVKKFSELNDSKYLLIKDGIQNISNEYIPDNSVDLIITDPPYMGQVAYSEYMQLYESFLNTKIDYLNEIVISNAPKRNKNEVTYWKMLSEGFQNISRVMKNESLLFMYFHDSNLSVWDKLIDILQNNDLAFISSVHVNKSKLTLKSIIDPKKTMNGDALLIFQKIDNNKWKQNEKDLETIIDEIKIKAEKMIEKSKEKKLSSAELYDNGILELIIKNDYLHTLAKNYKDLLDVFEKFLIWDKDSMKWKKEDE